MTCDSQLRQTLSLFGMTTNHTRPTATIGGGELSFASTCTRDHSSSVFSKQQQNPAGRLIFGRQNVARYVLKLWSHSTTCMVKRNQHKESSPQIILFLSFVLVSLCKGNSIQFQCSKLLHLLLRRSEVAIQHKSWLLCVLVTMKQLCLVDQKNQSQATPPRRVHKRKAQLHLEALSDPFYGSSKRNNDVNPDAEEE